MTASGAGPSRLLIPLANPRTAADLVRVGAALLAPGGTLTALSVVEVPEGMPLSEGAIRARQARRLLQRVLEFVPPDVTVRTVVRIGRRAAEAIAEYVAEEEADLVLFGWGGLPHGESEAVFSPTIDAVVRDPASDIAVMKRLGPIEPERILVPVRGGPHAELAVRYATRLAAAFGARVEVLHVIPPGLDRGVRARAEQALTVFVEEHAGGRRIHHGIGEAARGGASGARGGRASRSARGRLVESTSVSAAILRELEHTDLIVMGASAVARDYGEQTLFGVLPELVVREARTTVMVVKTRVPPSQADFAARAGEPQTLEAADRAVEAGFSVPVLVDRWFAESNFHHSEFKDVRRLVEMKERQGLSISAVLPTLDEAATIGPIVRATRRKLMESVPLIDELLVIDSGSSDDTRAIAEAEGARVVLHGDVLPGIGSHRGKGEALWKSLHETRGDLIAWSDTDIRDWHPRFFYGTLGPLLTEPRIGYVKAYYQRPIVEHGVLTAGGGGRVTELVARPLINLFFPELSGYIQPLSGEYAGRREHLEQIPFFTGYAVELGHLIDLSERLGLGGLGQVDLDIRFHRNQELEGLSRMSFVILQAVIRRLEQRKRSRLFAELGSTMKLPRSSPDVLTLEVIDLADDERPPIVTVEEYRRRRDDLAAARDAPTAAP